MRFQDNLNSLLLKQEQNDEFSGVVLIHQRNECIFSGAYGYAHRGFKIKNNIDTRFRVGSITKMFTAVSILQLVEKGSLSLETSIVDYLELDKTPIPREVNIYHLLTHTSGIADYFDEMNSEDGDWEKLWAEKPIYNMRRHSDYLEMFINKEPVSEPGKDFAYNGAGYILLGMAIERASGLTYFDYVKKNIFETLDMKNSDFLSLDIVYENTAEGYEPVRSESGCITGWARNIYSTTPDAAADGGSSSSAGDLIKFIKALRNGRLLPMELTKKMLSPQVPLNYPPNPSGNIWYYGFANYILVDGDKRIIRGGHTGEEYGASGRLFYFPQLDIDVAILGNQGFCTGKLGQAIHDMILSK